MALCITHSSRTTPTDFSLQEENCIQTLEKVAELIFKSPYKEMSSLIVENGLVKTLDLLFGKIFKEIMKIGDDSVTILQ